MNTYSELIGRPEIDQAETVFRVRHNAAGLGHLDNDFGLVKQLRPKFIRCQYTVFRIYPKAASGEWDAWAAARGIDPEVGYIHHGGVRKAVPWASTHWVMNMGSAQWRGYRRTKAVGEAMNYDHGDPSAPYELLQLDLVLWYPTADDTAILTSDEYVGVPANENHPYMVGCAAAFLELAAMLDLRFPAGRCRLYGNFGSSAFLRQTDKNTKAILAASREVFGQVVWTTNGSDTSLDVSNITPELGTIDAELSAGRSFYGGFVDTAAPSDKAHALAAALFALCGQEWDAHDRLFARYAAAPDTSPARIETWEKPELLNMVNYLGRPLGPRFATQGGRLIERYFERGRVAVWLKAVKTNPSDQYIWTVPAGSYRLMPDGTFGALDPGPTTQTLYANGGELVVYALPPSAVVAPVAPTVATVGGSTPPTASALLHTLVDDGVPAADPTDYYTLLTFTQYVQHRAAAPPAGLDRLLGSLYVLWDQNWDGNGFPGSDVSLIVNGRTLYRQAVSREFGGALGVIMRRVDLTRDELDALDVRVDMHLNSGSDPPAE